MWYFKKFIYMDFMRGVPQCFVMLEWKIRQGKEKSVSVKAMCISSINLVTL